MGVSKISGTPKWMVKIRENPIKMDDLGGPPLFLVQHPNVDFHQPIFHVHLPRDHAALASEMTFAVHSIVRLLVSRSVEQGSSEKQNMHYEG